jgi:multidrug efflux pump subunit AcrA (membrane-fusion protein)
MVTFDDPSVVSQLVEGSDATVTVDVRTGRTDGLAVPLAALHAGAQSGASAVSVLTSTGTTREVEVHPGAYGDGWVEVSSDGLHRGDLVRLG